jgi:hypothetical protein
MESKVARAAFMRSARTVADEKFLGSELLQSPIVSAILHERYS